MNWVSRMLALDVCMDLIQWEPLSYDSGMGFVREFHIV
jgi:hypothetical protein